MKHLTGLLRSRLKRLSLSSPYDEIIFLFQNLESFSRLLGKKVDDPRYKPISQLVFDAAIQEALESIGSISGENSKLVIRHWFTTPNFGIHERLSEREFSVTVKCKLEVRKEGDGQLLHSDNEMRPLTIKVKHERAFDLVNQAFGDDPLVT